MFIKANVKTLATPQKYYTVLMRTVLLFSVNIINLLLPLKKYITHTINISIFQQILISPECIYYMIPIKREHFFKLNVK